MSLSSFAGCWACSLSSTRCCTFRPTWCSITSLIFRAIVKDIIKRPYVTAGFTAFVLMIPLAITSTAAMIRRLGKRWQQLHRLVYVAAIAGVVHFYWLVKADIRRPVQYGSVLAVLLGLPIGHNMGAAMAEVPKVPVVPFVQVVVVNHRWFAQHSRIWAIARAALRYEHQSSADFCIGGSSPSLARSVALFHRASQRYVVRRGSLCADPRCPERRSAPSSITKIANAASSVVNPVARTDS